MISYIEGQVLFVEANAAVIKTAGVGYHVIMGKNDLDILTEGQMLEAFIHTHVREDALELFGFTSRLNRQIFLMLISISGIGPRLGLSILSGLSSHELLLAIINKDIDKLCQIPGVGKKTAERIALELKDKASKMDIPHEQAGSHSARTSLEQAIRGLGYSKSQSDKALLMLEARDLDLPFEELIKKTINMLSGKAS